MGQLWVWESTIPNYPRGWPQRLVVVSVYIWAMFQIGQQEHRSGQGPNPAGQECSRADWVVSVRGTQFGVPAVGLERLESDFEEGWRELEDGLGEGLLCAASIYPSCVYSQSSAKASGISVARVRL